LCAGRSAYSVWQTRVDALAWQTRVGALMHQTRVDALMWQARVNALMASAFVRVRRVMSALVGGLAADARSTTNRGQEIQHFAEPRLRIVRVLADPLEVFDQLALLGDIE